MTNREVARQKARELVRKMTVEEKASQLRYDAPGIPRLGVPAYNWWNEALHGVARAGIATSFPQAIGMAASFDIDLLHRVGEVIATEGRAKYNMFSSEGDRGIYKGLTFWAPNINIFRDPRWGRGHETYGEDPYLTGELGKAFVQGLQGEGETMKAAACAKHFAVHSGPEGERHHFDAEVSDKDLWETYLPAFEKLVKEAEVEAVMGAYNRTNGEPCCGSKLLMEDILRGKWDFQGHFVSDCWAIRDFHTEHMVTDTPEESAALALKHGCDVNCGNTYLHMLSAYEKGLVTEEEITLAAERLFTTRYLLGLFDGSEYDEIGYDKVECDEHLALADKATAQSVVLLKNNGILPLKKDSLKTIGVIGPNANSREALIGNYFGTASRYITVLEGIQDAVKGQARVLYAEGSNLFKERVRGGVKEATYVAKNSDVVLLCVGLDATLEGEQGDTGNSEAAGDKLDLLLPKVQRELIQEVLAVGKPTIILNMTGSAMDLRFEQEHADAILQLWYPGARGGKVIADILFGDISPSGKLPVTFYMDSADLPDFKDYSMKGRTYRYLEKEPLYPFGYGLTYGDVDICKVTYGDEAVQTGSSIALNVDDVVEFTVELKNSSEVATDEVVQVYVKATQDAEEVPNGKLGGIQRVHVSGGGCAKYTLAVDKNAFSVVDKNGCRRKAQGPFEISIGFGQPDERTLALTGKECIKFYVSYTNL
ncbi:MAG: glycoside hydrolase family 3 C-terminal domain-containing protein [Lachnospiraceae bacterium]|nr:glycoside hydrolase family 3 C-terminal domain-containing protein [Lachnospiraceae bacterium]